MKIMFAGGGTAGHINPALAVAGYIKQRHPDAQLTYVGTPRGMESRLVPQAGIDFYTVDVAGFQRKLSLKNIGRNFSAAYKYALSGKRAKKILTDIKPDVVMGTGGYVSEPVLMQAAKLGIKCCIHEQNAFAGVANKMLAPKVDRVMIAMPEAEKYFNCKQKPVVTGNPVRPSVIEMTKEKAREILGIDSNKFVLLSFGGSLGARRVNETVADVINWHWQSNQIEHFHATGKLGYDMFMGLMNKKGIDTSAPNLHISEYINNMDVLLSAADLVICRSGAITISELAIQGKPSILIPSPNVAENHQYHNAMTLVKADAAMILEEKDLSGQTLTNMVKSVIEDKEKLNKMSINAKKCAIVDTNQRIYDVIMELYKQAK
ncbi:MAG: undecaprenyldiphospho-muramoylpentapeptide beta-N-acetylglucosaminyltransferase [Acutalibacteraceae bacterium]|nr:undecaprenyldiphospho-muramoylpentapeptide beta-N-acetylglucosaminyltransferase [Acutalibacteraceae bacterium]